MIHIWPMFAGTRQILFPKDPTPVWARSDLETVAPESRGDCVPWLLTPWTHHDGVWGLTWRLSVDLIPDSLRPALNSSFRIIPTSSNFSLEMSFVCFNWEGEEEKEGRGRKKETCLTSSLGWRCELESPLLTHKAHVLQNWVHNWRCTQYFNQKGIYHFITNSMWHYATQINHVLRKPFSLTEKDSRHYRHSLVYIYSWISQNGIQLYTAARPFNFHTITTILSHIVSKHWLHSFKWLLTILLCSFSV